MRQDKRRDEGRRCLSSSFQPQAFACISLDYTLLPRKILVHTLVYTAWVFAVFSPPKLVTVGRVFKYISSVKTLTDD